MPGLGSASSGSANTYYTRDNNGRLVSQRTSTGTYYYSLNSLGSVSVMTDGTGVVKNTYAYDPWGNSLGKTEAVSNPWQFASGYFDATTGLYKFGTRYYSPTLGRWTQKDPVGGSVGKMGSGNAYVYASNNPVNRIDPSGKSDIMCAGAWLVFYLTFDSIAGPTLSAFFGAALVLLAGGPIGAFFAGLVLGAAFFAVLSEFVFLFNSLVAPTCGYQQLSV